MVLCALMFIQSEYVILCSLSGTYLALCQFLEEVYSRLYAFGKNTVHVFVFSNFISWDETYQNFSVQKPLKIAVNTC